MISDKETFQFPESVFNEFRFLREMYGFRCIEKNERYVLFRRNHVYVELLHDLYGAIGCRISDGPNLARGFSLHYLVAIHDPERLKDIRCLMSEKPEIVQEAIRKHAEILRAYGDRILRGDAREFTKMSKRYDWEMDRGSAEQTMPLATKAIRESRYAAAVALLEPIEHVLTPAEHRKLAYARKHAHRK